MDFSLFFLNWKRIAFLVVLPLLVRLAIIFTSEFLTVPATDELSKIKVYDESIKRLESTISRQEAILKPFYAESSVPFREYFIAEISRISKRSSVDIEMDSTTKDIGSNLQSSVFTISGNAGSLNEMSVFLDSVMKSGKVVMTNLSVENTAGREDLVPAFSFNVVFERVELKLAASGV